LHGQGKVWLGKAQAKHGAALLSQAGRRRSSTTHNGVTQEQGGAKQCTALHSNVQRDTALALRGIAMRRTGVAGCCHALYCKA